MDVFGEPKFAALDTDLSPYRMYERLSPLHTHTFLLESLSGPGAMSEISVMGFDPRMIIRGYADRVEMQTQNDIKTVRTKNPFEALRGQMRVSGYTAHRYVGGAVGTVNYDAIRLIEDMPELHRIPQPLFEFGLYDDGVLYDHSTGKAHYFWYDANRQDMLNQEAAKSKPFEAGQPVPDTDYYSFADMVRRARQYIYEGDIFQVVLSRRFLFKTAGNNLRLYAKLRRVNPSPYMFHVKHDKRTCIGASPEMLIRVTDDRVETFPIAGTRKRTKDEKENQRLAAEMLSDEKECAEHTMLVDLGRNDIGRVCRHGTVHPDSLMEVKRFSHVQHMVTHVVGQMDAKYDMFDVFKSVFPAGTVSGAPKIRAMEIIDELEPHARGPYAGAAGYFSYNGCCDFAISIRTIFIEGDSGFLQSGAGIVYDSVSRREFQETEEKAGAMFQAIQEASVS